MPGKLGFKSIPKTPDYQKLEQEILKFWEDNQCFIKLLEKNKDKPKYIFYDGPITANNPMGVHHAWGRTYKDVYQRYKAMQGFQQRYQNGFDTQGLWVEVEVEKDLGLNSKKDILDYGLKKFSRACRQRVETYADRITKQSIRLGQWMDWDNLRPNGLGSYYTFTDNNIEHIWHFLQKCQENGWLYKGHKVMPWCQRCGTSLSQHELIDSYKELEHDSVFLRFPLKNRKNESLLVWTTTPWTLTSNVSAAVHPDLEYAKVKAGDEIFYISQTLTAIIDHRDEVLETLYGEDMEGWEYEGPFDELPALEGVKHKVILWDEISAAEGTGIVHIAPGCGAEDFELGKEHNLPAIAPLDESGYFLPEFGELAGTHVNESAKRVFDSLIKKGLLYKTDMYTHRYPICWRCKDELVFRLTDEWFISCEEIRPRMIREVRKVKWFPEYGGKRMEDWLRNMGDWCISRKRYWGLPLPIYECECGETTFIGTKKELEERAIEGLESLELAKHEGMQDLTLHRPWIDDVKIACPKCEKSVSRTTDVGDCWLDAGIIPFSTLNYLHDREHWEEWYPSDWISEMMEQVKLWFYSMLFMSVTLTDQTPYKSVLVYEKLFDEEGKPMHKSTGNAIWFDDAVEKLGGDVMRWVYCSANIRANLNFGYGLGEETTRKLLTLWNIYSFFFSNAELDDFNPKKAKKIPVSQRPLIDHWLLSKTQVLIKESREALDVYDVRSVVQKCEHFMDELSNTYIRQNRRRFWGSSDKSDALAGYSTLYAALETFTRLLAPIIPFTSEYFYQKLVCAVDPEAPISVHLCDYPELNKKLLNEDLMGRFDAAQEIIYLGRSIRSKKDIIGRQPLQKILIWSASPKNIGLIEQFEAEILNELNVKGLEYVDDVKDLVEYEITPNFALVGPKYKQEVGLITQALKEYNPIEAVKHVAESRPLSLDVNGRKIELPPEEIVIKSNEKEGLAVMGEGDYVVALETTLTEELIQEGLARTVVRYIQDLRKKKDFNVTDKISVYFKTSDELITKAIETFKDYISKEILAITFETFDKAPKNLPVDELAIQKKPFLLKIQRHTP